MKCIFGSACANNLPVRANKEKKTYIKSKAHRTIRNTVYSVWTTTEYRQMLNFLSI